MSLKEVFDHTVFLLGAGASCEMNCLTSIKMLENLKYEIKNISQDDTHFGQYRESFDELYKFLLACLSYQTSQKNYSAISNDLYLSNVEDFILTLRKIINRDNILPLPLVGSWSDKLMLLQIRQKDIFDKFLDFIYKCIIKWLTPNEEKIREVFRPIKKLFEETTEQEYRINIFSLNYDLTFEKSFNSSDAKIVNNGFLGEVWDFNYREIDDSRINLYKIHGSLDWYKENDLPYCRLDHVPCFDDDNPFGIKPHIILGFENKLFSVDPFFSLIQQFIKKLESSKLIVVIGYSFFDNYINNILIQHLNSDLNKRMIVVDPKWAIKGQLDFIKYIQHIQSDTSTLNISNYTTLIETGVSIFNEGKASLIEESHNYNDYGTSAFYSEYFEDKCKRLIEEYETISKIDEPF